MIPILCFDIETIPDVAGLRSLHDLDAGLSDDEVVMLAQTSLERTRGHNFFPHHLQKIVAISCVFRDDSGFQVKSLGSVDDDASEREALLVKAFYKTIERYTPQLVSWNGGGFDLPVLHYRALIHGVAAPRYWDWGDDNKDFKWNSYLGRYHTRHLDLMDVLAMHQGKANAPLDEMAKLCGFPGKLGMDGSQVWPAYQRGELADIRDYCETDVVNTYLVYSRFRMMRGELSAEAYAQEVALVRSSLEAINAPHWQEYLIEWKPLL